MVINALNSGKTFMADFEDNTSPTWKFNDRATKFKRHVKNISLEDTVKQKIQLKR
jgi:malate synthase